jgi:hypothetical protein
MTRRSNLDCAGHVLFPANLPPPRRDPRGLGAFVKNWAVVLEKPVARIDSWRIGDLRGRRRPQLQELLLAAGSAADSHLVLVAGHVDRLGEHVADLQSRVGQLERTTSAVPDAAGHEARAGYVLFFASAAGYQLLEVDETAFDPDARELALDGRTYAVQRIGRSPLPGDRRRCAFLQPSDYPATRRRDGMENGGNLS